MSISRNFLSVKKYIYIGYKHFNIEREPSTDFVYNPFLWTGSLCKFHMVRIGLQKQEPATPSSHHNCRCLTQARSGMLFPQNLSSLTQTKRKWAVGAEFSMITKKRWNPYILLQEFHRAALFQVTLFISYLHYVELCVVSSLFSLQIWSLSPSYLSVPQRLVPMASTSPGCHIC